MYWTHVKKKETTRLQSKICIKLNLLVNKNRFPRAAARSHASSTTAVSSLPIVVTKTISKLHPQTTSYQVDWFSRARDAWVWIENELPCQRGRPMSVSVMIRSKKKKEKQGNINRHYIIAHMVAPSAQARNSPSRLWLRQRKLDRFVLCSLLVHHTWVSRHRFIMTINQRST